MMPGSVMAWPASATMRRSASARRAQVPGVLDGRHHVVAAVHDDAGDVPDASDVGEQLVVALEEAAVDEVVALDARKRDGVVVGSELLDALGVLYKRQRRCPPTRTRRARPRAARRGRDG